MLINKSWIGKYYIKRSLQWGVYMCVISVQFSVFKIDYIMLYIKYAIYSFSKIHKFHFHTFQTKSKFKTAFLLSVAWTDYVGNMASSDVHVRICEQEILKYDLEIKALIQVRIFIW